MDNRRGKMRNTKLQNIKIRMRVEIEVMEANQTEPQIVLGTGTLDIKTEADRLKYITGIKEGNKAMIDRLKSTLDQRADQELATYEARRAIEKEKRDEVLRTPLDQAALRRLLVYDKDTGEFRRLKKTLRYKPGSLASRPPRSAGMRNVVQIKYKVYQADKLAFLYMTGELPTRTVTHLDGMTFNDAWTNLELGPPPIESNITSGVTGVCWNKQAKKWQATLYYNKRQNNLGQFVHLEHAVKARYEAELKYKPQDTNRPTPAALYIAEQLLK